MVLCIEPICACAHLVTAARLFSALRQWNNIIKIKVEIGERYAMIKGRVLGAQTKDPNVSKLQKMLRPFVYRRYIDFSVIQS